jgi:hypothetical protein
MAVSGEIVNPREWHSLAKTPCLRPPPPSFQDIHHVAMGRRRHWLLICSAFTDMLLCCIHRGYGNFSIVPAGSREYPRGAQNVWVAKRGGAL